MSTVFRFRIYDISTDQYQASNRWATADAIERVCGEIVGQRVEVDDSDISDEVPGMTARNFDPTRRAAFRLRCGRC